MSRRDIVPDGYRAEGGLVTLGPEALRLRGELDRIFAGWGAQAGADAIAYPPLIPAGDLTALDYWENFPHLALPVAGVREDARKGLVVNAEHPVIGHGALSDAGHVLPSSACYPVYPGLAGTVVEDATLISTVANCFRNETHFDGLRRLMGFTMREVVFLGTREHVLDRGAEFKRLTVEFAAALGLPVEVRAAGDPFFDTNGKRSLMLSLFPAKEEVVHGGSVAIASVNFHRNFFGERCGIRTGDGEYAFSGCIGWGLERWLHALIDHFGSVEKALGALDATVRE
ncbi:hypothetical protein [Streptomyces sp. NBC_01022]|uniref:hypothetical protein n=1 Tax=Streptomyces sp. NBC_01022 TaxID=2903723 RepID=UPI002DD92A1C|nr:hypothetical protein [Streptomyces sp. NBC_01022]WRZ84564.1 hypothetical protein OG316_32030 [Streptomyces sp. NBC_01022]